MNGESVCPVMPERIWSVYKVPIVLGVVSILFIVLSITIFIKSYQRITPITFSSDMQGLTGSDSASLSEMMIYVDIEGAVIRPGVYRLPQGSRIDDALVVAGGYTDRADIEVVAHSVNRAAKLSDGAKLYIPILGEGLGESSSNPNTSSFPVGSGVNINSATSQELEALSGIGPVTAGEIIAGRPYTRLEELIEKKVVSQSLFEKLKDKLML